jgi:hypothetical protein
LQHNFADVFILLAAFLVTPKTPIAYIISGPDKVKLPSAGWQSTPNQI